MWRVSGKDHLRKNRPADRGKSARAAHPTDASKVIDLVSPNGQFDDVLRSNVSMKSEDGE
jgi:hypothetical protein